jgi:glycosyltransferase involved in cell wall biosynthesis
MTNSAYISFIMPAKNTALFINEAIQGVKSQTRSNWELIIIDDQSTDGTFEIAKNESLNDSRISLYRNIGKGKVSGLNYGYSKANGSIIKCIDSDDILDSRFVEYSLQYQYEAMCHNFFIISSLNRKLGISKMNNKYISNRFDFVLEELLCLPRCTWSFNRYLANKIFPMPEALPYEDLWFSLVIKRYSKSILKINAPLYYYRQHTNQTYGGLFNFDKEIVVFRSYRNLKVIQILVENPERFTASANFMKTNLSAIKTYLQLMHKENLYVKEVLSSNLTFSKMIKIIMIKKTPKLASFLKKLKTINNYIISIFNRLIVKDL